MSKPKILIVDDNSSYLESISLALDGYFCVRTASSGLEALEIMGDADNISLILLDLQMPEMTGVEFIEKIRSENNKVPIIVVTGKSNHEWARKCAEIGVQGYMDKLVDVDELISKVKKLLGTEDYDLLKIIWKSDYESKLSAISPTIKKALKYVNDNYQGELTREEVAEYMKLSPDYLGKVFYGECGIHLREYINMLKICKCKECLMDFDMKIKEVASMVGISDVNYLSRLFKKYMGLTPTDYRNKHIKPSR